LVNWFVSSGSQLVSRLPVREFFGRSAVQSISEPISQSVSHSAS